MSTTPSRFRKKPVVIEAVRFTGTAENSTAVDAWINGTDAEPDGWGECDYWEIETLEGTMTAQPGDWIIRGVQGEFYPIKPDIFAATYEAADADGGAR